MNAILANDKELDQALYGKDTSYDGLFYACVKTTGVFCKPSCPARKPKKQNVVYHATVRDCLLDGFRPCKRCRPLAANGQGGAWLDTLLSRLEESPQERILDKELSQFGISPHRVRRYFKGNFGMTFQAYHRARRMGLALQQLRAGEDALTVGFDQSYESSSGFHDAFKRVFGTTPGRATSVTPIHTMRLETPIGPMVAGAVEDGVCLLEFADRRGFVRQVERLRKKLGGVIVPGRNAHLDHLHRELREYFDGRRTEFTVPLVTPGSMFQESVWEELQGIPFGETTSYTKLARRIGRPGAQRAVGRANGDNRIAILIPCHRVVRDDGTLCGYGGGFWRKQHLLDLERNASQTLADQQNRRPRSIAG